MVSKKVFGENMSLIQRIAALHVLFHKYRSEILWFGQLVGRFPALIVTITEDIVRNQHEMVQIIIIDSATYVVFSVLYSHT